MSNIMSMTKLKNKVSRNGFDLSRKNLFTAKVGEMLPVACIECIPGDSFNIDMSWFTRTQPVNTAAYTRIREYYDWFFVPTNLLWDKFNTFVTQMTDNNQKATGINNNVLLSDEHPYMTVNQVANYIRTQFTNDNVQGGLQNFFGYSRAELSVKLLHYLDYGDFSRFLSGDPTAETNYVNAKLNPFPLLSYQKIYQDFVRDSQWEKAYAPSCNINYMTGSAGTNNLPISEIEYDKENMFDLRYYNWNKDYFMGLLPSPQYGDEAIVDVPASLFYQAIDTSGKPVDTQPGQGAEISTGYKSLAENAFMFRVLGYGNNIAQLPSQFSVLALRHAEAKQKWAEITQSQQQDYKSQVEAHFGVNVSDAYSDRCKYIGGVSGSLDIEAVTNQNLTGSNDANIAGRGQGGSRGQISFDTKVHGYLMCIYHCAPLLDYAIDGVKRQNLKTLVTDYAIPEFDSTGMVSVPLIELTNKRYALTDNFGSLLGYAPRYVDYKTGYDLVHGGFFNGGLDNWVAPVSKDYIEEYLINLGTTISGGVFNYHFFKIPPSVLDSIFGVAADSSVNTDQFLINCAFDIKAVRNLDRNGLPY